jgi:hypothetical protein
MAISIYREVATDVSIARRLSPIYCFQKTIMFIYVEGNFHENIGNFLTGVSLHIYIYRIHLLTKSSNGLEEYKNSSPFLKLSTNILSLCQNSIFIPKFLLYFLLLFFYYMPNSIWCSCSIHVDHSRTLWSSFLFFIFLFL